MIKTTLVLVVALVFSGEDVAVAFPSFTGGDPLVTPEQIVSKNGVLDYTLEVDIAELDFEWLTLKRRVYNKRAPAPTIRIKPGDKFNLNLVNKLTYPNPDNHKHNAWHQPNSTNIHLHGLNVSPEKPQDNVLFAIKPGGTFNYKYQFYDDLPPGTYWYHPHWHGSVYFQISSGMAGIFIVEDSTDSYITPPHIQDVSCPLHCENDIQLIFQPLLMFSTEDMFFKAQEDMEDNKEFRFNKTLESYLEKHVQIMTTNGQIWPVLEMSTGQAKRFRLLNAGGFPVLALRLVEKGSTTPTNSCQVLEIAQDSIYFPDKLARDQYYGQTILSPARRCDWLVVCNFPGTYEIRSVPNANKMSTGIIPYYTGLLLTIKVNGGATNVPLPISLPSPPWFIEDLTKVKREDIDGYFTLELSGGLMLNRELFNTTNHNYRYAARVGTIQEWTIVNAYTTTSHPMHIHVNSFQIISYNKYTGPYAYDDANDTTVLYNQENQQCKYQYPAFPGGKVPAPAHEDPLKYLGHDERFKIGGPDTVGYAYGNPYRDVILVPPLANITIRFRQHRFTGPIVIHCHISFHEDFGMMMQTYSYDTDKVPVPIHRDANGILPTQCDHPLTTNDERRTFTLTPVNPTVAPHHPFWMTSSYNQLIKSILLCYHDVSARTNNWSFIDYDVDDVSDLISSCFKYASMAVQRNVPFFGPNMQQVYMRMLRRLYLLNFQRRLS